MMEFLQPLVPWIDLPVALVFLLVVLVALGFFREWATPDVVALCALGYILVFGLLPVSDVIEDGKLARRGLLSVFGNSAPITVAALFILSAGLERAGAITAAGALFSRVAGTSELRALLTLMISVAVLSAFINNTPIVVVFLPIVLAHARSTGMKASKLLIPLSFASILGGTCTLTGTSTNLIVDGVAQTYGQRPFTMFEITKLGLLYAAVGFVYLATAGRRLLPDRASLAELIQTSSSRDFLTQFSVEKGSSLIGKPLTETLLRQFPAARVLEVRRRGRTLNIPLDQLEIREMDRLLLTLHSSSIKRLNATDGVRFMAEAHLKELETRELKLIEGLIGPRSALVGKTLAEVGFRRNYGVEVLAIHRQGINLRGEVAKTRMAFGDTLLMQGPAEAIHRLQATRDFVNITEPPEPAAAPGKAWTGAAIAVAFILGVSFQVMPVPALAMLAALAMILARCLTAAQAYDAVQWNIIFLIFGMLGLGLAMDQTGAARVLVDGIMSVFGGFTPFVILSVVYLTSSILTEIISNNAVAALLTPIVLGIAGSLEYGGETGVDPRPFLVALMFGCSASFATPIGYQTNTYVYGAGGYKFADFARVGVPLNLGLWLLASVAIPLLWPFR